VRWGNPAAPPTSEAATETSLSVLSYSPTAPNIKQPNIQTLLKIQKLLLHLDGKGKSKNTSGNQTTLVKISTFSHLRALFFCITNQPTRKRG